MWEAILVCMLQIRLQFHMSDSTHEPYFFMKYQQRKKFGQLLAMESIAFFSLFEYTF